MKLEDLKVPFRWSADATLLNRNNNICRQFKYRLITPNDRMLPFLARFITPDVETLPSVWRVYNADTNAEVANLDSLVNTLIGYYRFENWDYLVYTGTPLGITFNSGYYYSVIGLDNGDNIYSEEFWVDCDAAGAEFSGDFNGDFNEDFGPPAMLGGMKKYTKIQWWHTCNIGPLLYQTGYQNVVFIDSEILREQPEIIEEGREDGNKDFVPSFVKYIDKIALRDYVPEHVLNALLAVPIHKNILVTTAGNLYVGRAKRFESTFERVSDCYGVLDIKFQLHINLYRNNCCDGTENPVVDVYGCNELIGVPVATVTGNNVHLEWPVLQGTGSKFEVTTSAVSGGAPQIVNTASFNFNAPEGVYIVAVKPRCEKAGGRVSYGPVQTVRVEIL